MNRFAVSMSLVALAAVLSSCQSECKENASGEQVCEDDTNVRCEPNQRANEWSLAPQPDWICPISSGAGSTTSSSSGSGNTSASGGASSGAPGSSTQRSSSVTSAGSSSVVGSSTAMGTSLPGSSSTGSSTSAPDSSAASQASSTPASGSGGVSTSAVVSSSGPAGSSSGGAFPFCPGGIVLPNPSFETPELNLGGISTGTGPSAFNGWEIEMGTVRLVYPGQATANRPPQTNPLAAPAHGNQYLELGSNAHIIHTIPNPTPGTYRLTMAARGQASPLQGDFNFGGDFFQFFVTNGAFATYSANTTVAMGAAGLRVRIGNGGGGPGAYSQIDSLCLELLP